MSVANTQRQKYRVFHREHVDLTLLYTSRFVWHVQDKRNAAIRMHTPEEIRRIRIRLFQVLYDCVMCMRCVHVCIGYVSAYTCKLRVDVFVGYVSNRLCVLVRACSFVTALLCRFITVYPARQVVGWLRKSSA